ncbi:hypothetical protein [Streptomyces sp. NPDC055189]
MNRTPADRQRRRNLYDASSGRWPTVRAPHQGAATATPSVPREPGALK